MTSEAIAPSAKTSKLAYSYFVVALLMLAYLLSLMDRVLLGLLAEPIRADLNLNDTQLGLLLGFGFVLFYSGLGIPLGAMADAYNRRNLMVAGILVWSLATAGSGFAGGFIGLLIARTLVGAGEATLSPCALSTIGDRFERQHLGVAVGIYSLGGSIGIGAAMALGGFLTEWSADLVIALPFATLEGWRVVLFLVGLAGIPFALLMLLTVREPERRVAKSATQSGPMRDVFAYIARNRAAFFGLLFGFGVLVIVTYIPMLWAPAYFSRTHGLTPRDLAIPFALIFGLGSGIGLLLGGWASDRMLRRGIADAPIRVILSSLPLQAPAAYFAFTSADANIALWALGAQLFFNSMLGGLQGVTVQLMTPSHMHGRMMAIYLLAITLIGMGMGPLIVGALSDLFANGGGLGLALSTTMICALIVCATILLGMRPKMKALIEQQAQAA